MIEEGAAICADTKVLSGAIEVDMSAVTGESAPVVRQAGETVPGSPDVPSTRVIDATDVLLSGTTCTSGEALAVVVRTGMSTELRRIATLSGRARTEKSPLEQQVRKVAWLIAAVAAGVGVAFLPLGVLAGLSWTQAAVFAIGLLVANVPEGLLPTITLALAVGVADLAKRGGLVKRLSAIETLGSTDVICTDKTGTLTQNRMQFHSVWDATAHHPPSAALKVDLATVLVACSTADLDTQSGDPTEVALLKAASRWMGPEAFAAGPHLGAPGADRGDYRLFRFDPRLRLMTVVSPAKRVDARSTGSGPAALTKGAPEAVLRRATHLEGGEGVREVLTGEAGAAITSRLDDLAQRGLRLIAHARRDLDSDLSDSEDRALVEQDLTLLGFVALSDPLRDAVPEAVAQAHEAGITVHVITGDNGRTAAAIAATAGIGTWSAPGSPAAQIPGVATIRVVTGDEVDAMTDAQLDETLASGAEMVFARSTPENKLAIATRLQAAGHVVAMTGDGVNDAPALRQADIGVAMGRSGTDVAREAATMVLTDDDFATIIRAVEAGRQVYDNVRKFILYIFAHAVPFLLFALSGGSIPLGLNRHPDPGHRPRHRDTAGPGPGPREGGARDHAGSTPEQERGHHHRSRAGARVGRTRNRVRAPDHSRLPLDPAACRMAPGRCHGRGIGFARGLPPGHDDDLRGHRGLPDRNGARRPDRPRLPPPRGPVLQPAAARRHRFRAGRHRRSDLPADRTGSPRHPLARLVRARRPGDLPRDRVGNGRDLPRRRTPPGRTSRSGNPAELGMLRFLRPIRGVMEVETALTL